MLPVIDNLLALPPDEMIQRLLDEPESQWFDRKSARINGTDLAETLVAMANAEGGMIAIGLYDGVCEGISDRPGKQGEWRGAGLNFTAPPVRYDVHLLDCVNQYGVTDWLFVLEIPPSEQVHATGKGDVYLRLGDSNRKLNFEQRIQLGYDRGDTSFEKTSASNYGGTELDSQAMAEYAKAVGHPSPGRLLQARDLIDKDGAPYLAGRLLFGLYPQQAYPQAYVRVLRYAGLERRTGTLQNIVSDVRCEGPLPQQIDMARQVAREVMPKQRALGTDGRFEWFSIIPEEVWLEALVNAVIHRAYSNFGDHIRLEVFDDRVEVSSPGRFPGITSLNDLMNVPRFARNPRIARVMAELSYGQEMGEGLRRMVEAMEAAGKQRPMVTQTAGGVTVTLLGVEADVNELPPTAREVFQHLSRISHARTGDLILLTNYSRPVVLRSLRVLESLGLVQRVGNSPTDPRAYWTISANTRRSLL